jgi:hypothetical protein
MPHFETHGFYLAVYIEDSSCAEVFAGVLGTCCYHLEEGRRDRTTDRLATVSHHHEA